jgi:hypothetical protein
MDEINFYIAETEDDIRRVDELLANEKEYTVIGVCRDTDDEAAFMMKFIITLNRMLNQLGCNVIFTKDSISDKMTNTYCYDIKLANSKFMNSYILNMSDDFYRIIETAFTKFDLKFSYNNTRSCVFLNKKN